MSDCHCIWDCRDHKVNNPPYNLPHRIEHSQVSISISIFYVGEAPDSFKVHHLTWFATLFLSTLLVQCWLESREGSWTGWTPPEKTASPQFFQPGLWGEPCEREKAKESTAVFLVFFGRGSEGWQQGWVNTVWHLQICQDVEKSLKSKEQSLERKTWIPCPASVTVVEQAQEWCLLLAARV